MGLFSKRQRSSGSAPDYPSTPRPVDRATIDLSQADQVVINLCNGIGNHAKMSAATSRLMEASGLPDPDRPYDVIRAMEVDGPAYSQRLWHWLVAAAERANEADAPEVAVRAYWWATSWIYAIQPTLPPNWSIQIGFGSAPPGIHAALVREAERALPHLSEDFVVALTAEPATVLAGPLVPIVAEQMKAGGDLAVDQAAMRVMSRSGNEPVA